MNMCTQTSCTQKGYNYLKEYKLFLNERFGFKFLKDDTGLMNFLFLVESIDFLLIVVPGTLLIDQFYMRVYSRILV